MLLISNLMRPRALDSPWSAAIVCLWGERRSLAGQCSANRRCRTVTPERSLESTALDHRSETSSGRRDDRECVGIRAVAHS